MQERRLCKDCCHSLIRLPWLQEWKIVLRPRDSWLRCGGWCCLWWPAITICWEWKAGRCWRGDWGVKVRVIPAQRREVVVWAAEVAFCRRSSISCEVCSECGSWCPDSYLCVLLLVALSCLLLLLSLAILHLLAECLGAWAWGFGAGAEEWVDVRYWRNRQLLWRLMKWVIQWC